jgi:D-alanine-D-alanine ligase
MKKLRLALLSGGISSEREVSLNSGKQVYDALDKEKYEIVRYDPKYDLAKLVADAPGIDAALIILHGPFGEDGTVQGLFDLLDIPYQGSGVLGSAVAMNKHIAKQLYEKAGLTVPAYRVFKKGPQIDPGGLIDTLGLPLVVKPVELGSSVGMTIVRTPEQLPPAMEKAFSKDSSAMVEAFIDGVELTAGVIGNDELEAFPLIEIIPNKEYEFFDYEAKYTPGATSEICPARIGDADRDKAQEAAKAAHRALACRGYSRTDMILREGEVYILETNTIPGMTATSLLPQAAAKAGYSFGALLDRLIELGIEAHAARKGRG